MTHPHITVLRRETIEGLALGEGDVAIDCTVGAGGHTEKLLETVGTKGLVIGIDRDESALHLATERLGKAVKERRLILEKAPFSKIRDVARKHGQEGRVKGICADLGVSSMHFDRANRGFSFSQEGPLDMRMDSDAPLTAEEVLATWSEQELARIFREYGEEPRSRQVARRIVERRIERPFKTTTELAEFVKSALSYKTKSKKHPATKIFQALRLAVNDELEELNKLLIDGFECLAPGGRMAVITFHSLEDRLAKRTFLNLSGKRKRAQIPRDLPLSEEEINQLSERRATIVGAFPLIPSQNEVASNPRSRSAKLRILEKLP